MTLFIADTRLINNWFTVSCFALNVSNAVIHKCYNRTRCSGSFEKYVTNNKCCLGFEDGLSYHTGDGCKTCIGNMLHGFHIAYTGTTLTFLSSTWIWK